MGNLNSKKKSNKNQHQANSNYETIPVPNKLSIYKKNNKHLICDDASANRLVLKKYLDYFGCTADEAENGSDAIDKVKENGEYDIIWMDIKMPKMDGHECTKILRQKLKYEGKIIGLTGYVDDESIKKCYEVGMNYVVPKPFDSRTIQMYVERSSHK